MIHFTLIDGQSILIPIIISIHTEIGATIICGIYIDIITEYIVTVVMIGIGIMVMIGICIMVILMVDIMVIMYMFKILIMVIETMEVLDQRTINEICL